MAARLRRALLHCPFRRRKGKQKQELKVIVSEQYSTEPKRNSCYVGTDEPDSMAFGSITDGVFDGKIHSRDGVFYVEKAAKYFTRSDNSTNGSAGGREEPAFHSIIYKEAHVVDPYEEHRTGLILSVLPFLVVLRDRAHLWYRCHELLDRRSLGIAARRYNQDGWSDQQD